VNQLRNDGVSSPLRVLIADDEEPALNFLTHTLRSDPRVEVAIACRDGEEAVRCLMTSAFDLAFLDIQMPGRTGFEVIEAVGPARMPPVIFTTAYDQYALRAFEVEAVDYLLKPFDETRLRTAVARVLARAHSSADLVRLAERLRSLMPPSSAPVTRRPADRLVVRENGRAVIIQMPEIERIEAAGNYCEIYTLKEKHLLRQPISRLEAELDAKRFIRIHRSTIVRQDRIRQIETSFQGDYVVTLRDGTRLPAGRTYRQAIQELLGRPGD
jgi:two-component system LytT family response regulator